MKNDKLYQILVQLYVEVYRYIGEDFDSIDKVDGWFKNYYIDETEETKIVNDFLAGQKLSELQKKIIKINYYSGCSPTIKI